MNTQWQEKCTQVGEYDDGIYPMHEILMQMHQLWESKNQRHCGVLMPEGD